MDPLLTHDKADTNPSITYHFCEQKKYFVLESSQKILNLTFVYLAAYILQVSGLNIIG